MRRNLIIGTGVLLMLAGAGLSLATTNEVVKAKVPFAFKVMDREMPAGDYELFVVDSSEPGAWVVRSTDGRHEEIAVTEPVESQKPAAATELVFDVMGREHFLRKIYFEGEENGLEIAVTSAERALEAKGTTKTEHHLACTHAPRHTLTSDKAKS
jgi:hypothetical protein